MKRRILGRFVAAAILSLASLTSHAGLSGAGGIELAQTVVSGTFTGTGNGTSAQFLGMFNVTLSGTYVATVILERSFDGGVTFFPLPTDTIGTPNAYTAPTTLVVNEPEPGAIYRLRCSSYGSGTVTYRMAAGPRNQ
jgi:hypothetical protein